MIDITPKISVIIPTYNRADLLPRSISSVLDQSYKNFELIIVDDGSTDNTKAEVDKYDDKRILYIKLKNNSGVSHARNVGIKKASGDYVAFLDSDDEWMSSKLEKQISIFKKENKKIGIVGCFRSNVNELGVEVFRSNTIYNGDVLMNLLENWMVRYDVMNSSIALVDKVVFENIGYFDETLKDHEDYDLWIRIASQYEFYTVPESLAKCFRWKKTARMSGSNYFDNKKKFFEKNRVFFEMYPYLLKKKSLWLGSFALEVGEKQESRLIFKNALFTKPYTIHNFIALVMFLLSFFGTKSYLYLKKCIKHL